MGTYITTELQAWQTRVIDECAEMNEKINKLYDFLCKPRDETQLTEEVSTLMHRQLTAMSNYRDILRERIGLFF